MEDGETGVHGHHAYCGNILESGHVIGHPHLMVEGIVPVATNKRMWHANIWVNIELYFSIGSKLVFKLFCSSIVKHSTFHYIIFRSQKT